MNKFNIGDQVIVHDLPSLFHTRTQGYTRGHIGTVVMLRLNLAQSFRLMLKCACMILIKKHVI